MNLNRPHYYNCRFCQTLFFTKANRQVFCSLDVQLEGCEDAKSWDMLTRAKERLFKAWVHLAGIPGPGQRKPAPERREQPRSAMPEPTLASAAPTPSPVVTRPVGWEYDNQTGEQAGVRGEAGQGISLAQP